MKDEEGFGGVGRGSEGLRVQGHGPSAPLIAHGEPTAANEPALYAKLQRVHGILRALGRVIVAFSGGVDSTLLAKLARDVLGRDQVLAVTADSASLARGDLAEAVRLAAALDLEHLIIRTGEIEQPDYRANTLTRCYICKHTLYGELETLAATRGIRAVLYGGIADDLREVRPGQRAARERGVVAPLQEAGLEKWDVRSLARRLGLSNWDRAQNACLSSRVPHGEPVTQEKLVQIERAEAVLRARGFRQVRVRHLGARARIEVGQEEVSRFEDAMLCEAIAAAFERIGFATVAVDRAGYRAGGADQAPTDEAPLRALEQSSRRRSSVGRAADS